MLALSHQCGKTINRRKTPSSVVGWAVGFEKVLEDPMGLRTFTEFLKREFSAENIMFWILCEHYRNQTDKHQRKKLAKDIVQHHLCQGAPEPINIDSQTRQSAIERAEEAPIDLFVPAQKQIFTLMKFDCYQRFLKSELYAESLTAEKLGKPLPCQDISGSKSPKKCRSRSKSRERNRMLKATKLNLVNNFSKDCNDNNSTTGEDSPKDEVDEKKRKSLLPWQKGRGRNAETERSGSRSPVMGERNTTFRRSKRKPAGKKDKAEPERSTPTEDLDTSEKSTNKLLFDEGSDGPSDFCRVTLPDSSAAVLSTNTDETLGEIIRKLLVKHGLLVTSLEAFMKDSRIAVDQSAPFSNFGGKEVLVERKAIIRLDLPSGKSIAVKSNPERFCGEVLEPILSKYGHDIRDVALQFASTDVPLNLNGPISSADSCQVVVRMKDPGKGTMEHLSIVRERKRLETKERNVTSCIFEDIAKGKGSFFFDELGVLDLDRARQERTSDPGTLSANDTDSTRRSSLTLTKEKPKTRSLYSNRASMHEGSGMKLPVSDVISQKENPCAPRRSLTKNVHYRESNDLTGVWNRAQRRLDDQRGTELNCELPEFLRLKREVTTSPLATESDL